MTKEDVVSLLRETNQIYLGMLYNGFLFGADTAKDVAIAAVRCAETRTAGRHRQGHGARARRDARRIGAGRRWAC